MRYLELSLAVIFNVCGYIIFKKISGRQHDVVWVLAFAGALGLGAINVYFFTRALRGINFSVAYPAFAGASVTLVVLASAMLFHERLLPVHLLGAATVVLGIYLLTR